MPEIRHAISIQSPAARIFPLVSTAHGLAQWWAADISPAPPSLPDPAQDPGQPPLGPILDIGFYDRSSLYRLALARLAPPRLADWLCLSGNEWTRTRLSFSLRENSSATLLLFTHSGWPAESDYFLSCNTTWGGLLFRLKIVAEGKSPGPLFTLSGSNY
jgi:hypothetical protein